MFKVLLFLYSGRFCNSRDVAALLASVRRLRLHSARANPATPKPMTRMTATAPVKEEGKWKLMTDHESSFIDSWLKSPYVFTTSVALDPHIMYFSLIMMSSG